MIKLFIIETKLWFRRKENLFWSILWPNLWLIFMCFVIGAMPGKTKLESLQYYVPAALTLILISSPFTGLALNLSINKENNMLKRFAVMPFSIYNYFLVVYIACLLFSLFSIISIIIFATILGLPLNYSIIQLLILIFIGFFSFSAIAFLIAGLAKSISVTNIITMFLMFILMFVSNLFFDLSAAPPILYQISLLTPSSLICSMFRDIISGTNITSLENIVILLFWGIVPLLIARRYFRYY